MSLVSFSSNIEVTKFFFRVIGLILIPVLIIYASINPTILKIYSLTFITFGLILFLFYTSYDMRKSFARMIGQHKIAFNLSESVEGQINLMDQVKERGEIKIVSSELFSDFYNDQLILKSFEKAIIEKHAKIYIAYGPTNNQKFIDWAKSLGIEMIPLKRTPKKNFTVVDRLHVRWKKMRLTIPKNNIHFDCSFYGKRVDILFQKYVKKGTS